MLKTKADELGVDEDLRPQGKSQDLTLYGSPECRERIDCLVGLEESTASSSSRSTRSTSGCATRCSTRARRTPRSCSPRTPSCRRTRTSTSCSRTTRAIFPSGNVIWVTDQSTVQKAGPDYQATIEKVQKGLTLPVMQELNARVDIDKQEPGGRGDRVPEGGRLHPVVRSATEAVPRGPGLSPRPSVYTAAPARAKSPRSHRGERRTQRGSHPRGESQPTGS